MIRIYIKLGLEGGGGKTFAHNFILLRNIYSTHLGTLLIVKKKIVTSELYLDLYLE